MIIGFFERIFQENYWEPKGVNKEGELGGLNHMKG
jgi:hypothetical protein